MNKPLHVIALGAVLGCLSPLATANPEYRFDWDDREDMRGAHFMCAIRQFEGSRCRQVLRRCWRPPMIYLQRHRDHFHTRSHCTRLPSFNWTRDDNDRATRYAAQQAGITITEAPDDTPESYYEDQSITGNQVMDANQVHAMLCNQNPIYCGVDFSGSNIPPELLQNEDLERNVETMSPEQIEAELCAQNPDFCGASLNADD